MLQQAAFKDVIYANYFFRVTKEQYDYTDQYKGRMEELGFDEVYISTKEEQ